MHWLSVSRRKVAGSMVDLPVVSDDAAMVTTRDFGTCQWDMGVKCVIDGDTFWMHGEKIRIGDIEASGALR